MISGNQQASEQFYLQRCGADDFMKKPFDRDDVAERIGQLVNAGRLAPRETLGAAVEALVGDRCRRCTRPHSRHRHARRG